MDHAGPFTADVIQAAGRFCFLPQGPLGFAAKDAREDP